MTGFVYILDALTLGVHKGNEAREGCRRGLLMVLFCWAWPIMLLGLVGLMFAKAIAVADLPSLLPRGPKETGGGQLSVLESPAGKVKK